MGSVRNNKPKRVEHIHKLLEAVDYLNDLDPSEMSSEEYELLEESILRLYIRRKIALAVDEILEPTLSELGDTLGRTRMLCQEAIDHARRTSPQSESIRATSRGIASRRSLTRFSDEEI